MEMKYYNPSNNFRAPIPREPRPYMPPKRETENVFMQEEMPIPQISHKDPEQRSDGVKTEKKKGFLSDLDKDDMLLFGLIAILLLNACDDYLLLLVLGYLFISGRQKSF